MKKRKRKKKKIEAKMNKHRNIMKKKNKKTKKDINHRKKIINVLSIDKSENTEIKKKKFLYLNF